MLAGQTKSGKSAVAEAVTYLDPTFIQVAFADILKEDFANVFGIPLEDLHDVTQKDVYRPGIVKYADQMRAKDPYRYVRGLYTMLDSQPGNYIIDDMRSVEELDWGLKRGGRPYRVYAEDNVRRFRGWKPNLVVDNHYLENELILTQETYKKYLGGGWIYNNTQSLEDVMNRAYALLQDVNR